MFPDFSVQEADGGGLPRKRSLAERLRKKADLEQTPRRGTDVRQASGLLYCPLAAASCLLQAFFDTYEA